MQVKKLLTGIVAVLIAVCTLSIPTHALPQGTLINLGSPVTGVSDIWTLTTFVNGSVFGGTSGGPAGSHLFLYNLNNPYDPSANTFEDLGNHNLEIYTLTTFTDPTTDKTMIFGGAIGNDNAARSADLFTYDPWTNAFTNLGPWYKISGGPVSQGHTDVPGSDSSEAMVYDLIDGGNGKIYGCTGYANDPGLGNRKDAFMFEYDTETNTITGTSWVGTTGNYEVSVEALTKGFDGKIYYITDDPSNPPQPPESELWCHNPATSEVVDSYVVPDKGHYIYAITAGIYMGDSVIYWATTDSSPDFGYYDPSTGTSQTLGIITGAGGVRTLATGLDWLIYGGTYSGNFFIWDGFTTTGNSPAWAPGTAKTSNPLIIGPVFGADRIRCLAVGLSGMDPYVYGGTHGNPPIMFAYKMITPDLYDDGTVGLKDLVGLAQQYGADPPGKGLQTSPVTSSGSTSPAEGQVSVSMVAAAMISVAVVASVYKLGSRAKRKKH